MTEKGLREIFGQNIRRYRSYRELSQADFAEKINISIPFLSDIENGKKWVSPSSLIKISNALSIDAYELFKPETIIPDNSVSMLEKYTAEIYKTLGDSLNNIQQNYINQIKKRKA